MYPGIHARIEVPQKTFQAFSNFLKRGFAGGVGLLTTRPGSVELYEVGTLCHVLVVNSEKQGGNSGKVQLVVEGRSRFRVCSCKQMSPLPIMTVQLFMEPHMSDGINTTVLVLRIKANVLELLGPHKTTKEDLQWPSTASLLADAAAAALNPPSLELRQQILETVDLQQRLQLVLTLLNREVEVQRSGVDKGSSKFKWPRGRWTANALGRQVGGIDEDDSIDDESSSDAVQLRGRLSRAGLSKEAVAIAKRELQRLKVLQPQHPEYAVTCKYLETLAELPWKTQTEDCVNLAAASTLLDGEHYGLHAAKKRILEFLAVQKLSGRASGPILCLNGPPGVGKTSLGHSIAKALGRKFHRVALGGLRDEAMLRGHRRTYIGSGPGVIIQALQSCGVNNPVILLDEIDKLSHGPSFNPEAVLLEILDPEQNTGFVDHYVGTPFDLSRVIFICTANNTSLIGRPLLDRMEALELSGYTLEEKVSIAEKQLLPKQRRQHGLQLNEPVGDGATDVALATAPGEEAAPNVLLNITPQALVSLVSHWTSESGVRSLERRVAQICRWAVLQLQRNTAAAPDRGAGDVHAAVSAGSGECRHDQAVHTSFPCPDVTDRVTVDECHLQYILGPPLSESTLLQQQNLAVGTALGFGASASGAKSLFVEAVCLPSSSGQLKVTGGTGPVMLESIQAALSLLKTCFIGRHFPSSNIHIHVPCTGPVRDSPSSGLTVLLALASLLLQQPCQADSASIGEVTLRGQVLAADGVRDAVLAARRAGLRHLLLPLASQRQVLEKVPPSALGDLELHYVRHAREALAWMFGESLKVDIENETVMDDACSSNTNHLSLQGCRGAGKGLSQPFAGVNITCASKL